jgi:hypothetical protein
MNDAAWALSAFFVALMVWDFVRVEKENRSKNDR